MAQIGFSTGSLYLSGMPLDQIVSMYLDAGADAIELSFGTPQQLLTFGPSAELTSKIKIFGALTIHAPFKDVRYEKDAQTSLIIRKLELMQVRFSSLGIVFHPDTISDEGYSVLEKSRLSVLLENMDRRKNYGTHPAHIEELAENPQFGFVLDLQHAYEHDPTMGLAKKLIDIMGSRLTHLHVSGCGEDESEIHVPLYRAKNKNAIASVLQICPKVPRILEGNLVGVSLEEMKQEIAYVRSLEEQ